MEEKADKELQKEYIFDAVCFSTNYKNFSSMKIINQYFMNVDNLDINRIDENNVIFKKKVKIGDKAEIECTNKIFEVSPMEKNVKLKKDNDCFIIFVDLEYNYSLGELNKTLKIIENLNENDKYLYIINFYTEENNIKKNIDENNIKNLLDRNGFSNYSINKINLNISEELIKTIDAIIFETLQNKKLIDFDNKETSMDRSNLTICIIN